MKSILLRIALTFSLCTLLAACAAPYRTPKMNPPDSDFPGIYDALAASGSKKSVDVILVHGMCTHDATWVAQTNQALAKSLGMSTDGADPPIPLGDPATPDDNANAAQLYSAHLTGAGFTVNTFSIVWSPITDAAKRSLCYDVTSAYASCTGADSAITGKRVIANRFLKERILDNCLSDAVFYAGGTGKKKIKSAIQKGISWVLFRSLTDQCGERSVTPFDKKDVPLIVLTESLGSKMFYDTLHDINSACSQASPNNFANALERPVEVFMLANQMPILSLADPATDAQQKKTLLPGTLTPGLESVIETLKLSTPEGVPTPTVRKQKGLAIEGANAPKWIVAFSDPNDLFSYTLRSAECEAGKPCEKVDQIYFSDVLVSNDWSYLFAVENPYSAHTEYLLRTASGMNQVVAKMIACGGRGYQGRCDLSTIGAGGADAP